MKKHHIDTFQVFFFFYGFDVIMLKIKKIYKKYNILMHFQLESSVEKNQHIYNIGII